MTMGGRGRGDSVDNMVGRTTLRWILACVVAGCGGPDPSDDAGARDGGMTGECSSAQPCESGSVCVDGACVASTCGDLVVDTAAGEECDDGNAFAFDGCDPPSCQFTCERAIDCDDGNPCDGMEMCPTDSHLCMEGTPAAEGEACVTTAVTGICRASDLRCVEPGCGNGVVEAEEECDDGNTDAADGCEPTCTVSCATDADCLDADQCNGNETCDLTTHACVDGPDPTCGDTSACTTDTCDMNLGCLNTLIDGDSDGHAPRMGTCGDDCDDTNPTVFVGAEELCDGLDNDCDSISDNFVPSWFIDCDGDGFAPSTVGAVQSCNPPGTPPGGCPPGAPQWVSLRPVGPSTIDCDDEDETVHPRAPEICDRLDSDCSSGGGTDTAEDADDDGYSAPNAICMNGFPKTDCDDNDDRVHPGQTAWFGERGPEDARANGSWDFDCDGVATAELYDAFPATQCQICALTQDPNWNCGWNLYGNTCGAPGWPGPYTYNNRFMGFGSCGFNCTDGLGNYWCCATVREGFINGSRVACGAEGTWSVCGECGTGADGTVWARNPVNTTRRQHCH
jgi:cysteine-rich repeat protein